MKDSKQVLCGKQWLPSYPEAICQLPRGHAHEHYHKNAVFSVIWESDTNIESQKKIKLSGEK